MGADLFALMPELVLATLGMVVLVAGVAFGPRRGLAAVRVGREVLIVGVTNTDLKLFRVVGSEEFLAGAGPAQTERLRRLLLIVPFAAKKPGVTVSELARRLGLSIDELKDHIEVIRHLEDPNLVFMHLA